MRSRHVARAIYDRPWAILPAYLELVAGRVGEWLEGLRPDAAFLLELRQEAEAKAAAHQAAILAAGGRMRGAGGGDEPAVIPVLGPIVHRASMMTEMCGGASVQGIRTAFRAALADASVPGIVLDVDSPGGYVDGVPELADEIRQARGQKPIVAVSNTMMASAAYWLASAADEIIVSPSSVTGSIGVYMAHVDESVANEAEGVKVTYIYAGANKVEGNPDEPLSDKTRAYFQGQVDATYDQFVSAVSKGRGVPASTVRGASWGQGRVLMAKEAVAAGMADRVGTVEDAIARIARGKVGMRAAADPMQQLAQTASTTLGTAVNLEWVTTPLPLREPEHPIDADEPVTAASETEAQRLALAKARQRARRPLTAS